MSNAALDKGLGYVDLKTDKQGIATISFFHPAQNSLPGYLLSQLAAVIDKAGHDNATRVIVIKSEGQTAFCAGASFDELLQITTAEQGTAFFSGFANVINACRKSPKVIIGRVHGKAVGGGVGIAAATDHCFATVNADIKLSELTIGIGPFVIEPAIVRKMGISAFSQMTLNASEFSTAHWASDKGLFADVFETAEHMDAVINELAQKMTLWSAEALTEFKRVLWEGTENWDSLLAERAAISARLVVSAYAQNALSKLKSKH